MLEDYRGFPWAFSGISGSPLLIRKFVVPKESKLRLVRDDGKPPDHISDLSEEEQARLLNLADIALANSKGDGAKPRAGDRAQQEHEKLKQEIQEAVERIQTERERKAG